MRVSARGYRAWASRPACKRQRTDLKLLAHIHEHDALSNAPYGRPRVTLELRKAGLDAGEQRIGRLMKDNGIRPVRIRRHKVATGGQRQLGVAAKPLDGDFLTAERNLKWAGDISYIWTTEGRLYPAVAIDLFSRRIVGWVVCDRMKKDLAVRVLEMAVDLRQPPKGLFSIPIVAANIALTASRRSRRPTACVHPCEESATAMAMRQSRPSSKA